MESTTAERALELLKQGNARFVSGHTDGRGRDVSRTRELVTVQHPYAVVLCCSDSRVVPELLFDTGLGDLFVIRVAGNVVNESTIASLELAVTFVDARLIVVMGHQNCAAVEAALNGLQAGPHVERLFSHIRPAIEITDDRRVDTVARHNCTINADRLVAESQIIRDAMETNGLRIATAFYHFETGRVEFD